MKPGKALRKFGDMCMRAPPGAQLTIGLSWVEGKGWRVMMQVHTGVLMLGSKDARGLALIYDRQFHSPQWEKIKTGLEWVPPELRAMADEADEKNAAETVPPEMLDMISTKGSA